MQLADFARVKCRDPTEVNNLFKLLNLVNKFFIRIKHNKKNRIGSTKFSTKMKMPKIEKHIKIAIKLREAIILKKSILLKMTFLSQKRAPGVNFLNAPIFFKNRLS